MKKKLFRIALCFSKLLFFILALAAFLFYEGILLFNNPGESEFPVRGVDVSAYQGEIDWKTLASVNISFAFIKATEGSFFVDRFFETNWEQAMKTELRIGAYHFFGYQRLLAEHNIKQSMSGKGNCMDNGAMENFFGRLKVEMFYGEKFESINAFIGELNKYIHYYNNERMSLKLKGMSPVQYRTHSQSI